jgi:hypothetical protein
MMLIAIAGCYFTVYHPLERHGFPRDIKKKQNG